MKKENAVLDFLSKLGRSLMLPIAILPVAGLMLRLGAGDLLNWPFLFKAGDAIFANLKIIFALGVAIGWAKENHGAAALAGYVSLVVINAVAPEFGKMINGTDAGTDMFILGGILAGLLGGGLYNKFYKIKLPTYLAFFGGRRFVPIITGLVSVLIAIPIAIIWPFFDKMLNGFSNWIIASGGIGLFLYGFFNRLLIVTGLHHILNSMVWFQFGEFTNAAGEVVKGDLWRFFANDKTAGAFMTGFFPIMMFGLPAAAAAMYTTAKSHKKKLAAGILFSAALTGLLTGVTEPIEFAFMFLAPVLYLFHAILTGISLVVMNILGVKLGFTFSAGLFDYILSWGIATKPWMLLIVGPIFSVIYYVLFVFAIKKWDIKTIGREDDETQGTPVAIQDANEKAAAYLLALGGAANVVEITHCTSRLRLKLNNTASIDEAKIKQLGARGLVKPSAHTLQVIIGTDVQFLAEDLKDEWKRQNGPVISQQGVDFSALAQDEVIKPTEEDLKKAQKILAILGNDNVKSASEGAGRLVVCVGNADEAALKALKAEGYIVIARDDKIMINVDRPAHIAQVLGDII